LPQQTWAFSGHSSAQCNLEKRTRNVFLVIGAWAIPLGGLRLFQNLGVL
jgi:hypothetical protein